MVSRIMASVETERGAWPIRFADVLAAERRIRAWVPETPLRRYAPLDAAAGSGLKIWIKHENQAPTNAFKVRNAFSVMTALTEEEGRRGIVTPTRGNHGLGVAYAASALGVRAVVCVPVGNNPEKNDGIRGYGAELVEEGRDYDEAVLVAERLVRERGMHLVHATNDPDVIAGAGTLTLEMLRAEPGLEAIVYAVGGGSQAVGGMTVVRTLKPGLEAFGVQAAGASAGHDSWREGRPVTSVSAATFADGLATRSSYAATFGALCEGLSDFVTVTDGEIADALRLLLRTTHNLAEGAGAAGLAGLVKLRDRLAGRAVGIVLSGGNIDRTTLSRVVAGEI
jgi:threonine dehydratase